MKTLFDQTIRKAESICVLGHISPDGDCIGSALGISNYVKKLFPEKNVRVYLGELSGKFSYLKGFDAVSNDSGENTVYDLCIVCDAADKGRLGRFVKYFEAAHTSFLIDHHFTNPGFCDSNVIEADSSSTCEVLYELLEEEVIDKDIAACIYTGLVHDTGVFKYSCTSERTMQIAGRCMSFGIDFGNIIDDSFYSMTYRQRKLLGHVMENLEVTPCGRFVYGKVDTKTMKTFGIENAKETDGFIDNIRNTSGTAGAAFFYQLADGRYKGSLRSNSDLLDVSIIAQRHDGGGHKKAAGCTLGKNPEEEIESIVKEVLDQLEP